jgi:hypothetical protein
MTVSHSSSSGRLPVMAGRGLVAVLLLLVLQLLDARTPRRSKVRLEAVRGSSANRPFGRC